MRKLLTIIVILLCTFLSSISSVRAESNYSWIKPVIRPVYNDLSVYLNSLLGAEYTPITSKDKLIADVANDKGEVVVGFQTEKPYLKIISEIPISDEDLFIFENLDNGEKVEFLGSTASSWQLIPGRYRVTASFITSKVGSIKFVQSDSPFKGNILYFSNEDEYADAEEFAREGGNVFVYSDIGYSAAGVKATNIPYTSSISKDVGNSFVDIGLKELPSLISLDCPAGTGYQLGEWTYICEIPLGEGSIIAISRSVLNLDSDLIEKFVKPRIGLLSNTGLLGWDNILPFIFSVLILLLVLVLIFIQKNNYHKRLEKLLSIIVVINTIIILFLSFIYLLAAFGRNNIATMLISDIFLTIDQYKYYLPQFLENIPAYQLLLFYTLASIFIPLIILLYLRYSKIIAMRYRKSMQYFVYALGILFVGMIIIKSNAIPLFNNKEILQLDSIVHPATFHGYREIIIESDSFYSIEDAYLATKSPHKEGNIYYDLSTSGITLSGLLESPNVNGKPTYYDYNIAKYQGVRNDGRICFGENLTSYLNPYLRKVSRALPEYVSFTPPDKYSTPLVLNFNNNFGGIEGYVYFEDNYSLKVESVDSNRLLQKGDLTIALYGLDGSLVEYKTLWDKNQEYDLQYRQNELAITGKISKPGLYYVIIFQGSFYELENYLLGYIDSNSLAGPVKIEKVEVNSNLAIFRGVGGNTVLPSNQEVFFQNLDGFELYSQGRKVDSLVLGETAFLNATKNANFKDSNTFYSLNRSSLDQISINIYPLDSACKDVYIKGSTRDLSLVPGQAIRIKIKSYNDSGVAINNLVIK